ncbi:hypothetical protein GTY86_26490 [Streptomyces sp. SID5770]|uniref:SMI1/KNR4 family protein n=1 Tax=Streptomyces sp. SID5770 TaxID=2690308 RepID=UPI0013684323|nr:SMI1/KNR4 family protein [Streptomyces sp. SID5770]MZE54755.1 hypothetical protein [Streptomyces sp. SID5770]
METVKAFTRLQSAVETQFPQFAGRLRPPAPFTVSWAERPGAEQVLSLWSATSGEPDEGLLGLCAGYRLLGPHESERERAKWVDLMDGSGLDAVANPSWDNSISLDPNAVRAVYFAAGWVPVLRRPLEADYLAVDLVPLSGGRPGQIVTCGRDVEEKIVVAPDLATLLTALSEECTAGNWAAQTVETTKTELPFLLRQGQDLLNACQDRTFPPQ